MNGSRSKVFRVSPKTTDLHFCLVNFDTSVVVYLPGITRYFSVASTAFMEFRFEKKLDWVSAYVGGWNVSRKKPS